jgi:hypothetical protein
MKKSILKVVCVSAMMLIAGSANAQSNNVEGLIGNVVSNVQSYKPETILKGAKEMTEIANNNPDSWLASYYSALFSMNYVSIMPKSNEDDNLLKNADKAIKKMLTMKDADLSEVYALKGMYYISLVTYGYDIHANMPNIYNSLMKSIFLNVNNPRPRILTILFNTVLTREKISEDEFDACDIKSIYGLFDKDKKHGLEPNWGKELLPKE